VSDFATSSAAASIGAAPRSQQVTPVPSPALTGLADCVQQRGRLDALLLIDESGSLKDTDPLNGRVDAIKTALSSLDALRDSGSSAPPPEITVQVAGFGVEYEQVAGWRRLDAKAGKTLQRGADAFASRNTSRDTDYFAALDGARQSFATRAGGSDGPACRLLLLFTDGRYDVEDRLPPRPDDLVTKYYAPDLRLDAPGGGQQMIDRGRGLLCAGGGVVDQLRDGGVVTLPVVLTTTISPEDQGFLDAIAAGGCGQRGSPATGTTFRVGDLPSAVLSFDQIANSTQASTALGTEQTGVCQQRRCPEGVREFTIDPVVRRFRAVVITGTPSGTVEVGVQGSDETIRVKSGTDGSQEIGGATVRYRWIGSSTLVLDCELGAGSDRERQGWNLVVSDPNAPAGTIASSEVTVFTDLTATLVEGQRFGLGDGTTFEIQLLDGDERLTDPGELGLDEVVATAVVKDPTTTEPIRIELESVGDGRFRGTYPATADVVPATFELQIELAATASSGLQLTPISRTYSVPLRAPSDYPQLVTRVLHLRPEEGSSSATGAVRVRAPDKTGCIRVDAVEITTFPASAGSVDIATEPAPAGSGCTRIPGGSAATIKVSATPATAVNGTGEGSVRLVLSNRDEKRPITVLVPLDYRLAQSTDLACIDEGVIVASPSGIDVIRDCGPQAVATGFPVLLATTDSRGRIVFQRKTTAPDGRTIGAPSIERIDQNSKVRVLVDAPPGGSLDLFGVADVAGAPTLLYESGTDPGADGVIDVEALARSIAGGEPTRLYSTDCPIEEPDGCGYVSGIAAGGGRYALNVGAEIYSWIEFRDAAGKEVDVPNNPFGDQGPSDAEGLVDVALSPDGKQIATIESAFDASDEDPVLVVRDLATGTETSRIPLWSGTPFYIQRLEFDGNRALVSVVDTDGNPANAVVVDVTTGGRTQISTPGVASFGLVGADLPLVREPTDAELATAVGCAGDCEISGRITMLHPKWGPGYLVATQNLSCVEGGVYFVDDSSKVRWRRRLAGAACTAIAIPPTDTLGHLFIYYSSGAGVNSHGLIVLRPTRRGFKDFGSLAPSPDNEAYGRFAGSRAEPRDLDGDGVAEIVVEVDACDPYCNAGQISGTTYKWNGSDYEESSSIDDSSRLFLDGIGPVLVGMTYDEVRAASGMELSVTDDLDTGGECVSVDLSGGPTGLSFMGSNGVIVRIQVYEPSAIKTKSGIGIGSTEQEVLATYPNQIGVSPHPYTDGSYLTFSPQDPADPHILIFETDGERVTSFRTGLREWVELIEGCA
jgi:hypothetical protein